VRIPSLRLVDMMRVAGTPLDSSEEHLAEHGSPRTARIFVFNLRVARTALQDEGKQVCGRFPDILQ